jgi:hypothetical protein
MSAFNGAQPNGSWTVSMVDDTLNAFQPWVRAMDALDPDHHPHSAGDGQEEDVREEAKEVA